LIPKDFSPKWAREKQYPNIGGIKLFSHKERSRTRFLTEQGKEAVVAILGPGHFFGEGCLNGHPLRIATTTAIDECVITRLEKATMIATIHNEAGFAIAPLQLLRFTTTCV
jgi:CRP-like cAMP-binding protein